MRRYLVMAIFLGSASTLFGLDEATVLGAAALPVAGHTYTQPPGPKLLAVRTNLAMATSKRITGGIDNQNGASKPTSSIVPACPRAAHPKGAHPFAIIGFPATTLKRNRAGKYAFTRSYTHRNVLVFTTSLKTKLKVVISGTVKSSSQIVGTVKVTGNYCGTSTIHFTAREQNA
jgi:hypothetical protein